jgi:hypothetical protein
MLQLLPPECDLSAILTGCLLALIPASGRWKLGTKQQSDGWKSRLALIGCHVTSRHVTSEELADGRLGSPGRSAN